VPVIPRESIPLIKGDGTLVHKNVVYPTVFVKSAANLTEFTAEGVKNP
jgi:hypothetical protein